MTRLRSPLRPVLRAPLYSPLVGKWGGGAGATVYPVAFKGWKSDYDNGTTGDYIVASDGSEDYTTIQAAWDAAVTAGGAKTILVMDKGAKYRAGGALLLNCGNASNITLLGYSADKPTLSAFTVLGAGTLCSGSDADVVGNLTGRPIYKATVAGSTFAIPSHLDLNLHEDGVFMANATDRADLSDMFIPDDYLTYHEADSMGLDGSNRVLTITDTSVFSAYTEAQLLQAKVMLYHYPNTVTRVNITAYDSGTKTITVDGLLTVASNNGSPTSADMKYSVINIGPAIEEGQWIATDDGGDSFTVYYWPRSASAEIEYSTFPTLIGVVTADDITIRGFRLEGTVGGGDASVSHGGAIATYNNNSVAKSGWTLEHLHISKMHRGAAINFSHVSDVDIGFITIYGVSDWFGTTFTGWSDNTTDNLKVHNFDIQQTSRAPLRALQIENVQFYYGYIEAVSKGAHANKWNYYQTAPKGLFWGIICGPECQGYVTFQAASGIVGGMSVITASPDGRALVDQNGATVPDSGTVENYFTNLLVMPQTGSASGNSVTLGDADNSLNFTLINSVVHGAVFVAGTKTKEDHNIITLLAGGLDADDYGTNDVIEEDLDVVYVDALGGDFRPAASSPIRTLAPYFDTASVVAAMEALFPDFDHFDKDIYGRPFTAPFVGVDSTYAAVDVVAPAISALSPADNATDVSVDAPLVIDFSEAVFLVAGGEVTLYDASDDSEIEVIDITTGTLSIDNTRLTITPTEFVGGTGIYIQISAGAVEDVSGNPFAGIADETTWSFSAAASSTPAPGFIASLTDATNKSNGQAWTFTAASIGDAHADRVLVLGVFCATNDTYTVTVGGETPSVISGTDAGVGWTMFKLETAGTSIENATTADIVVTNTSGGNMFSVHVNTGVCYPASPTPVDSGQAAASGTNVATISDLSVVAGGWVFFAGWSSATVSQTAAWNGVDALTQDTDITVETSRCIAGDILITETNSTRDLTLTPASTSSKSFAAVSYGAPA